MKRVVKTMSIIMLTFFLTMPCFARRVKFEKLERSSPIEQVPIVGDIDDDTHILTVNFLENIGNVGIEVRDQYGYAVSSEMVETATASEVSIQLAGVIVGDYSVIIVEENSSRYYGDFELY